jgi:hypothetical protein
MENSIPPPPPYLANMVAVPTAPRPTPTPVRVQFSDVLASGARALVRGAQAAASILPGAPIAAMALRGGATGWAATGGVPHLSATGSTVSAATVGTTPEGPGGTPAAPTGTTGASGAPTDDGIQSSMAQSEQMNLYYLQIQEEVNSQNRTFTALSNVLEVENNTAKSAIGNIH